MNRTQIELDARLKAVASCVRKGMRVADIGTDHGYLICYLVQKRICPGGIATDIRPGPLSNARSLIAECGLDDKITTSLCDGLDGIRPDSVDDIVIAGMGGENIAEILLRVNWLHNPLKKLILQPQTKAPFLRRSLWEAGFELTSECGVSEGTQCYTVMTAQFTGKPSEPSTLECMVGLLPTDSGADSKKYLRRCATQQRVRAMGLSHMPECAEEASILFRLADQIEALIP